MPGDHAFLVGGATLTRHWLLDLSLWRISERPCGQALRHVKTGHADPVVCHPVINVEAVRHIEIVAPVNAGWEHDVGDDTPAFLRQLWCQHRLRRAITDHVRMLLREHHRPG